MSITHEPRRQRYVIVVGGTRRVSTYDGEDVTQAEALAFARELARELMRKAEIAQAFAEEAALADDAEEAAELALEARAVLADEQAEADAWAQAAETCESCGAAGETFEQPDGRLLCAGCAGFMAEVDAGITVRIIGPAYTNAIGTIVPRTDWHQRDDLVRVRLDDYTDDEPVFVLMRKSEVTPLEAAA